MDEQDYKVVRLLDELLPTAATAQKSGVSFDIRLYLRENSKNGNLWAEVAFIDRDTGKLINTPETGTPLDTPEAVSWYFGWIAEKGFPLAVERRTQRRAEPTPGRATDEEEAA